MSSGLRLRLATVVSIGCITAALIPISSHAGLPLPDHIVFGTIAISNQPITSANTDVIVEARRASNAPVVSSYTMGSAARLGTYYYELRFQLEDASPSSAQVLLPGDQLLLTVRDANGVQFSMPYQIPNQGTVARLDFGSSVDANGNGVPDGWELAYLGTNNADVNLDSDGDGVPNWAEYVGGTNPTNADDSFYIEVTSAGNQVQVSFHTLAATGVGYEGMQRYYALESSTDLNSNRWQSLPNLSRVPGNGQTVVYSEPTGGTNGMTYFRARVWLERP
jgi:hypothetical protein